MEKYINLENNRYLLVNDYADKILLNYKLSSVIMWGQCVNGIDYNFYVCEYTNGKDTLKFRYAKRFNLFSKYF